MKTGAPSLSTEYLHYWQVTVSSLICLHYAMFRNVSGGFAMPKQPEHGRAIGGLDAVLAQVEADMAALVSRLITTGVPIKRPTKVRSNALAV